jgi:hypothetical protein
MIIRVTKSPMDIPEDSPFDDAAVEAIRFMDDRQRSAVELLRETSFELAQYQFRCEELEKRLAKYETVEEFDPKPYVHQLVSL